MSISYYEMGYNMSHERGSYQVGTEEYNRIAKEIDDNEDRLARTYGVNSKERIEFSQGAGSHRYN